MTNLNQQAARTSVDSISQKLKRCIDALKVHVTAEGRLDEYDQHAVRIMESRIRLLERFYAFLYGTQQEKDAAELEMRLHKKDDGTLIQLGEKRHGVGRLDCRACDTEEVEVNGRTIQRIATRLCVHCQDGIQHTYVERMEGNCGQSAQGIGVDIPDEVLNAPDARYGARQGENNPIFAIVQHKVCDSCGEKDLMVVGYEYPEPKKERWRQVML